MQSPLRHPIAVVSWLMVALLASPHVHAASSPDSIAFDKAVDDAIARYHLPGIAVGVIADGEVVYTRTAGERIAGSGEPITTETLFKIASNSKAMTASVLARLVQAGKLRWDDPVVNYLPDFAMHDPWVTRNMQVRDLLVHNSGLPEGGGDLMLWPEPNAFTRADIIHGLRYIKPAYGFRSGYAYDNLLYVVAGEVAAAAGGAPYEELVRREVFAPLGLARCRVGQFNRDQVGNVAQPHMRKDGRNVVFNEDEAVVPAITSAAAGGIRCSLTDMLAWARNWLAPSGQQLQWLSSKHRREMWTPRTPMPISQRRRDWDRTHYYAYALGFRVADADGAWTVSHTGTLSGMYSAMMLLPDSKSGFVLMINGDGDAARTVLTEVLLKHFTAPQLARSVDAHADELASEGAAPSHSRAPDVSVRTPAQAAQLRSWLGVWRDPWFGEVSICARNGAIRFSAVKSPLMRGQAMRVGERTLIDWDEDSVDAEAWLALAGSGADATLTMSKVDPEADFSFDYEDLAFTRVRACD
jgi:CubicO group peptidase (beta-lactamase class C family)